MYRFGIVLTHQVLDFRCGKPDAVYSGLTMQWAIQRYVRKH